MFGPVFDFLKDIFELAALVFERFARRHGLFGLGPVGPVVFFSSIRTSFAGLGECLSFLGDLLGQVSSWLSRTCSYTDGCLRRALALAPMHAKTCCVDLRWERRGHQTCVFSLCVLGARRGSSLFLR